MAALTKARQTRSRDRHINSLCLAANAKVFSGSLVMRNAAGNLTPGAAAVGCRGVGKARDTYDNTGGAAGDVVGEYENGVYEFDNSTSTDAIANADIGNTAYIVDDHTVAKTNGSATRSPAGIIVGIDAVTGGVWIDFIAGNLA